MALLFMDGFDSGDYASKYESVLGPSNLFSSTITRFTSGRSIGVRYNSSLGKSFTATTALYWGFAALAYKDTASSTQIVSIYGDNGATSHINLVYDLIGTRLLLRRGSTTIGECSMSINSWNYIEIGVTISDTVGTCEVRINGVPECIMFTGDTKNGGTNNSIDHVKYQGAGIMGEWLYDDMYITDSEFLGDVRVQTLVPSAAGLSTQFTPTGGANYANVADIPDSAATYNSSSTQGNRDTYAFSDLVAGTGTVFGIQTNMHAKKADAGLGPLKEAVVAGNTVYYGNTTQLPTSTAWVGQIREANPNTSTAWTVGDVNSLEAGAEVA